ncbi:MAG: peptidase M61 [Bacteroidota bacterium]
MRQLLFSIVLACSVGSIVAQPNPANKYVVYIDLTDVQDDQLKVTIQTPPVDSDYVEFQMPKMVPGTYAVYDFGRFMNRFEAFDLDGELMSVDSLSPNRRKINNAQSLAKITYWIEDSYDTNKENFIFEPAGTNIEADDNFVLNTYGFIGYLQGMKETPYEVVFKKLSGFYGASALIKTESDSIKDIFTASNYFNLADSPILYCKPDTVNVAVGGADVLVSVYSPNGILTADFVTENVSEILEATQSYLGGQLPVDRYAFLIHLLDRMSGSGGFGALEHSYSSLYCLPEFNPAMLAQTIRDVAAHEFLHIITPLNIHSEEIGNFDFINPKMSKHLWMYEGVTEYFAGHIQVHEGVMPTAQYLKVLKTKIEIAKEYKDDLPFTELSLGALDKHKDQYPNVYQKGALIGMALDIKLHEWSNGEYSLRQLMGDLSEKYGKDQSFKDEVLFGEIGQLTDPSIEDFLVRYVEGPEPLPYQELFEIVGIDYLLPEKISEITLGNVNLTVNAESQRFVVSNLIGMNAFGHELGYQPEDELLSLNKQEVDFNNYLPIFEEFKSTAVPGDKVTIEVLREVNGQKKKIKLKAKAMEIETKTEFDIQFMENPSPRQLELRNKWLGIE